MVKVSPQEGAQKWAQRLSNATQDIQRGVQRVTENPAEKAARNAQKWFNEIQRSFTEGRYQAALSQVTLESWKAAMLNKGVPRIAQGAQASLPKVEAIFRDLYAYESSLQQRVAQMPADTLEQRIQRAVEWIRGMSQYKKGAGGAGIRT